MLPIRNAKGKFGEGCVLSFGEDGTRMREGYRDYATAIENFEIRDDDIIVATFPKSGTTWTQEMVWLVKNCNNLEGSSADIHQRFPMLEGCTLQFPCKTEHWLRDSIEYLNQIKNQRFIKTHLPCSLLPNDIKYHRKTPKIIYVVRNPKDVCISYYHHFRNIVGFKGGVEDFFELFINDTILYAPYWKHVIGYYNIKHLSNVLIIKYEDMKRDLKAVIIKVQRFLESEPLTDKQLRLISQRLDFEFMKDNEFVNHQSFIDARKREIPQLTGRFMRAGCNGTYKQEMSTDQILKFDKWIEKNISNTELNDQYWFGNFNEPQHLDT